VKQIIIASLLFAVLLTACAKQGTVVNPPNPSPNVGVITALAVLSDACAIAAPLAPTAASWLDGPCVTGVTGIINVIQANGTVAQLQAIIRTMQMTAASVPAGTSGQTYVVAALALAQAALTAYEAATGQTITTVPSVSRPRKLQWTKYELDNLKTFKAQVRHHAHK
jgi:hypothetical protein